MAMEFRPFRVRKKQIECDNIVSLFLQPTDSKPLWPAAPGQYLTLKVPTNDGPVNRTYSLSSDCDDQHIYRITVKREPAPVDSPSARAGIGSTWIHDHVKVGDDLQVAPPRGSFVLDQTSDRPVILLAGGVGLTPLLSMLHALAKTNRNVWFFHACKNGSEHALREEVEKLSRASKGRIRSHFTYSSPTKMDQETMGFYSAGRINQDTLQRELPLDCYDAYICGPTPFMVAMYNLLVDLGVSPPNIAYEFFGKAHSLEELATAARQPIARPTNVARLGATLAAKNPNNSRQLESSALQGEEPLVTFAKSGKSIRWNDANSSLLEAAENAGLTPEFSCREGICNTCSCALLSGEVEYFEEPLDAQKPDKVLICCSRPTGDVVLDI